MARLPAFNPLWNCHQTASEGGPGSARQGLAGLRLAFVLEIKAALVNRREIGDEVRGPLVASRLDIATTNGRVTRSQCADAAALVRLDKL